MIDVDEELTKPCRRRGRIRIALPHFMRKCVDVAVLSATFACRFSLCASVRAVFGYEYLTRSHVSKRNISVFRML
jgi:hypothetical protein